MDYTIHAVSYSEFKTIYHSMMVKDFPKNELRPLFMFRSLFRKGAFTCLVMKDQETILGYACLIEHNTISLLDYFAINQAMRGSGIGTVFLAELKNYVSTDGMIIESELPYKAKTAAEKQVREKRVSFYERNGAEMSDYEWRAFGVGYHLLWYPFSDSSTRPKLNVEIQKLYTQAMPGFIVRRFTSLTEQ